MSATQPWPPLRQADEENRGTPLFIFVITMENHGPWLKPPTPDSSAVLVKSLARVPEASQAWAIIWRACASPDRMIGELQKRLGPEKGVLGFYGDHLPSFPAAFAHLSFGDIATDYFIWRGGSGPSRRARILPRRICRRHCWSCWTRRDSGICARGRAVLALSNAPGKSYAAPRTILAPDADPCRGVPDRPEILSRQSRHRRSLTNEAGSIRTGAPGRQAGTLAAAATFGSSPRISAISTATAWWCGVDFLPPETRGIEEPIAESAGPARIAGRRRRDSPYRARRNGARVRAGAGRAVGQSPLAGPDPLCRRFGAGAGQLCADDFFPKCARACAGSPIAASFHTSFHGESLSLLQDVAEEDGPLSCSRTIARTPARAAWLKQMSIIAAHSPDNETQEGSFRIAENELAGLRCRRRGASPCPPTH